MLRDGLAWVLVLGGSGFMLVGGLGVLRMPDFYTRQHAAGITDTSAAALILFALLLFAPDFLVAAKLVLILMFLLLTSPTASHALAQAAVASGVVPLADDWRTGENREAGRESAKDAGAGSGPASGERQ
ncbi:MAG: monovalent cation/H(+) antiporter subunit G [Alphaproteobacteria bacterium]|nr:monovalent cation/H(+) antiporter subunit G [Alphaproteobacteria bacterium]